MEGYLYVQEKRRWRSCLCRGKVVYQGLGREGEVMGHEVIQQGAESVEERAGWDGKVGASSPWEGESLPVPDQSLSPEQKGVNNA